MPTRAIPPRSDRGSIKNIQKAVTDSLDEDPNMPATPQELRIKALYENALVLRNQALIDSLGLIVMEGSAKDPVSVMRHRQYVQELTTKFGGQVEDTRQTLEVLVEETKNQPQEIIRSTYKRTGSLNAILAENQPLVKNASSGSTRAFWRAK